MSIETQVLHSARQALIDTLPEQTSSFGEPPELRFTHVPASHAKALDPDNQLVVGMRGAGKSFWWAALQNDSHRDLVAKLAPRSRLTRNAQIAVGFGVTPQPDAYPSRGVLSQLVQEHEPRQIWRTVILHALADPEGLPAGSWPERVAYVSSHPEAADRLLYERDLHFERQNLYWIILFDALDLSASDWVTMRALVRGLLEATLELRPYRRLRAKCFLRTDQLDEREVGTFPDASKVLAAKVELTWPPRELYSLLFQYLVNAESGAFREELERQFALSSSRLGIDGPEVWLPPSELRRDEGTLRDVFHAITGPWMGKDRRRGYPYTWVPSHLADAGGRVSPRSFLAALRKSAQDSAQRYSGHSWPLHYESIKRGVQEASRIRVGEIQEDYPWVHELMEPLEGKVVPCSFQEVEAAWQGRKVLRRLDERVARGLEKLPPAHLPEGAAGVRGDLEQLGIFLRLQDGRVNIPDVFRVGYGLGRRGGVKPMRRGDEG